LQQGKMIILVDDPSREDEGDLIFAAQQVTPEKINFMLQHTSGIICLPMAEEYMQKLGLLDMVPGSENTSARCTPFTVSIDAKTGISTGVSAYDRATTILTAIEKNVTPEKIVKPGHVFPLRAKSGGVLERNGHTEGSVDMVRLAGCQPAAVLCELMNTDGTMMRGQALLTFAEKHQLQLLAIADLVQYRLQNESVIEAETSAALPLQEYGDFQITIVKEKFTGQEHVVLSKNSLSAEAPYVRIHSACMTGDLFASKRCDCHAQLHYSLKKISQDGGVLIYLDQEGRGIGLFNKIKAYALQEKGLDTIEANQELGLPADMRKYHIAAHILKQRNIQHIRLLTNNPEKISELKKYGIEDVVREPFPAFSNECNKHYLQTKKSKLHHFIEECA